MVWKLRYKYFRFRPGLVAAIFDYRHPVTSGNNGSSAIEFRDPENIDLAVGISFLSYLEAEIYVFLLYSAILSAILNFPLLGNSQIASGMPALFTLCLETSVWPLTSARQESFNVACVIRVYIFLHEIRHLGRHFEKRS